MTEVRREHQIDLAAPPREALSAVAAAAERWGAAWRPGIDGGRLDLPVTAGVRRGVLSGELSVEPSASGSRLVLRVDESRYRVHWQAVLVLLFGAAGGIATLLWPFFPALLVFAPLGAVLAFAAWFMVASRLRSSGPEDFLSVVADGEADRDRGRSRTVPES